MLSILEADTYWINTWSPRDHGIKCPHCVPFPWKEAVTPKCIYILSATGEMSNRKLHANATRRYWFPYNYHPAKWKNYILLYIQIWVEWLVPQWEKGKPRHLPLQYLPYLYFIEAFCWPYSFRRKSAHMGLWGPIFPSVTWLPLSVAVTATWKTILHRFASGKSHNKGSLG